MLLGVMANPVLHRHRFQPVEIATVTKVFGFAVTLAGAAVGGVVVARYGAVRPLVLGAVLLAASNLFFIGLALAGPDPFWLVAAISADNLAAGFTGTVFIAYLSGLTNVAYTATQYALFTSLMTLPGRILSGFSGQIVESLDWVNFFIYGAGRHSAVLLAIVVVRRERARGGWWPAWRVGSAGALADPGTREFHVGDGDWPFRGFLLRLDGHLYAYANVCPHKQYPLNGADDDFLVPGQRLLRCAAHNALFEPESGLCLFGPCAGRSLKALECWVDDDEVWVRAPASLRESGLL